MDNAAARKGSWSRAWAELSGAACEGLTAVRARLYPNMVVCGCLLVAFVPYLAARGIDAAWRADQRGADDLTPHLVVASVRWGVDELPPPDAADRIAALSGVHRSLPCLTGSILIGRNYEAATVVGLPDEELAKYAERIAGRVPAKGSTTELVFGPTLARRLALKPGSNVPPFYRNPAGERVSQVTGVLRDGGPGDRANWILTTMDGAAQILGHPPTTNEFWLFCEPGRQQEVRDALLARESGEGQVPGRAWRVMAAEGGERGTRDLSGYAADAARGTAVVSLLVVLALAALVRTEFGGTESRRETAILSALGWSRRAILTRITTEGLTVAGTALVGAVLVSGAWLWMFAGVGLSAWLHPTWEPRGVESYAWDPTSAAILGVAGAIATCLGGWITTILTLRRPPAATLR